MAVHTEISKFMTLRHEVDRGLARGWRFTPLAGKRPIKAAWQTTNSDAAELSAHVASGGNVGLRTGTPSGIIVIDRDPGAPIPKELGLPPTWTVSTGRGQHHYFRTNGTDIKNSAGKLAPHVDVRGTGGQVVFPGSIHPETGVRYMWVPGLSPDDLPLADLPEHVATKLTAPPPPMARPPKPQRAEPDRAKLIERCHKYITKMDGAVSGQGGHNQTLEVACVCARFGLSVSEATALMLEYNARCSPPWTDREIEHKLTDAHAKVAADGELGSMGGNGTAPRKPRLAGGGVRDDAGPITIGWAADRFVDEHGQDVLYVPTAGGWHIFDGRRFARDETNAIGDLAAQTIRTLQELSINEKDRDRRTAIFKLACKLDSASGYTMLTSTAAARPGITIPPAGLDANGWLLNIENGTLDLHTGELRPHRREDRITKLAPVVFDQTADAPRWQQFLIEVFSGDIGLIGFIQRLIGHCLTGDITEHVLPIFYGSGRNGKNTLLDCVAGLMGDYAAPAPPNLLTARRTDEHPTELADLDGRRLVFASETEEGRSLRVALVKSITGDKYIKARLMRQDYYTFTRSHKTILLTNNRPRIREQSDAIWQRVLLVPFGVSFAGREDKALPATLAAEWPGILRWAVEGCLAWQRDGLGVPDAIRAATAEYRGSEDVLTPFLDDACVITPEARVSRTAIWQVYIEWCKKFGEDKADRNGLYERLRQHGFEEWRGREHGRVVRGFDGIGLLNTHENAVAVTGVTPVTPVSGYFPVSTTVQTNGKVLSHPVTPELEEAPDELRAYWERQAGQ